MAKQFGEDVPDGVAYRQVRDALKHLDDLDAAEKLVGDDPIKRRALDDERRERAAGEDR